MTRVTGTDHVLLLLQEQIARLASDRAKAKRNADSRKTASTEPLARLRDLARRDGLSEDELNRALVRSVMIDQLGESLGADPRFESLVGDVMRIIAESPDGRALFADAFRRLEQPPSAKTQTRSG